MQYWIIEDKTFYAINIAANMVISSQKFFKADRYRYVVPIFYFLIVLLTGEAYIQTIQEPQPCSPLVVGGSSFTLFSMGSDTFSKIN